MDANKKKKNRNKKGNQKGNQSKGADVGAEEVVVTEPDHGSAPVTEQDHHEYDGGDAVGKREVEVRVPNGCDDRVVMLENGIRELEDGKSKWMQTEVNLEEKIRLLQSGVEMCNQKEIILEEKLNGLMMENGSLTQKQVILENKVKHIEGIGDSWHPKEMSMTESITRLDEIGTYMQKQVTELKESKENILQENQQLKESINALELRIQYLETNTSSYGSSEVKISEFPEEKTLLYQMDVDNELVDTSADNEVLEKVERGLPNDKVQDVMTEPDQHAVTFEISSTELDHAKPPFSSSTSGDHASEYGEAPKPSERMHEVFDIHNSTENFSADTDINVQRRQMPEQDESRISEEIVSVPLDDIQVQDAAPEVLESNENMATPLSDAPLIGAPFRIISYFAKYVSGADLVEQKKSKSGG